MIRRSRLLAGVLLFVIFLSGRCVFADPSPNPIIRVELIRFFPVGTASVEISCSEPFTVTDSSGQLLVTAPSGTVYELKCDRNGMVTIASAGESDDAEESQTAAPIASPFVLFRSSAPTGVFAVSASHSGSLWHHYRGSMAVSAPCGLRLVNRVCLEDYITGVLQPEIGSSAPIEALKAQAVAARTYTLKNLCKLSAENADLDDTTRTEGYVGADGETAPIRQAEMETAGDVMTYRGALIDAVYSTDCGGATAPGGVDEPYLVSVQDGFCDSTPGWQAEVDQPALSNMLYGSSAASSPICLTVNSKDISGRVTQVTVSAGSDSRLMSGVQLRQALGYNIVRSTLFTVSELSKGKYRLDGRGWGHGMGMCQRGAIALAKACAAPYKAILAHYYSGVVVQPLNASMLAPPAAAVQSISSGPALPAP